MIRAITQLQLIQEMHLFFIKTFTQSYNACKYYLQYENLEEYIAKSFIFFHIFYIIQIKVWNKCI